MPGSRRLSTSRARPVAPSIGPPADCACEPHWATTPGSRAPAGGRDERDAEAAACPCGRVITIFVKAA
ncbi:MAG TPA: hypothetical protein VLT33_51805 [Labilithrix sp.]|nr:hypothetical protein [Labilithrix sp.]